jgi:hypothetical protein
MHDVHGVRYVNCGDWVDSCTAILEHGDGSLELVHWGATGAVERPRRAPAAAAAPLAAESIDERVESVA